MARGSATTDNRFAYFTPYSSTSVYRYEQSTAKWEELPSCRYPDSGLVIIDGKLTAVGGEKWSRNIDKLLTLQQGKWVEKYPPMNTARRSPAVVSTSKRECIIVIGGNVGYNTVTTTVELFHINSRTWYELLALPQPLPFPSATICGDTVYVIGIDNGYTCSLQPLVDSDQLILSWNSLPPLPVTDSTAATLCGQLVVIGGRRRDRSSVNSIHQLVDGQWVEIGSMTTGRKMCLVASPSPDKIIIVGGLRGLYEYLDIVEECVV